MAVYRSTILVLSLSISACVGREVIHHGCYVVDPFLRGTYTGECQEQMAHGRGVTIGKDSYQGDFVRGFLHGQGVYTWHDGDRFVGQFKNGHIDGRGVLIRRDGSRQEGCWQNNQQVSNAYCL